MFILACFSSALVAAGQAATPAKPATPAPPTAEKSPAATGSLYNAAGRRDPFVSLVGRGNDPKPGERRLRASPDCS